MTKKRIIYYLAIFLFPIFAFAQEAEKEQEVIAPIQEDKMEQV